MKGLMNLWSLVDPASQGDAYQKLKAEKLPKLSELFSFRLKSKWAYKRY